MPRRSMELLASSLFLFHIFQASTVFQPVCGNSELKALMDLKSSMDPENSILSSWMVNGNPCNGTFTGIICHSDHVVKIELPAKGLNGSLSSSISGLKNLWALHLQFNSLKGEIPKEIATLSGLTELYLNVNYFTGTIFTELGNLTSLRVLQLGNNQLEGVIPSQLRSLKNLSVLALRKNRLTGAIPADLGDLSSLTRLDLAYNHFIGSIPAKIAEISSLKYLDVRNNNFSGRFPSALKRLNDSLLLQNNSDLCGTNIPNLLDCNLDADDDKPESIKPGWDSPPVAGDVPQSTNLCSRHGCRKSLKSPAIAIFVGFAAAIVGGAIAGLIALAWHRRHKQKIGSALEASEGGHSTEQLKEWTARSGTPLISLEYSHAWDPLADFRFGSGLLEEMLQGFIFNLEEVENSTQHFSQVNLMGKNGFSATYKGVLRDGSRVAVKCINKTSCKAEELEYMKGLRILTSLQHQNLVKLRGFCYSSGRGECFLIYDFAQNGSLSSYLDVQEGRGRVLDWSTRVSIINGIAKGIKYLHSSKPALIHQNISAEKVLLDQQFSPLLADSGLYKLLANDAVFSSLKASAAKGYLAPEYGTLGMFTEKSNVYAFGAMVLQIISGKQQRDRSARFLVESGRFEGFMDEKLNGKFSEHEAMELAKIALLCTREDAEQRPTMKMIVEELDKCNCHFRGFESC